MTRARRAVILRASVALAAVAAAAVVVWPHATAWLNRERGKSEVEAAPRAAREHLLRTLATWPNDAETHFHLARAARLADDLDAAELHLKDAERHGWMPALIEAERRESREAVAQVVSDVRGLMAEFRWPEADGAANRWVELQPNSAAARAAQGRTRERLRKVQAALEAYREAHRLDPTDARVSFDLARLMLEVRQSPDEAAALLESLDRTDPQVRVYFAAAREAQGRVDEAATILDDILNSNPKNAKALFLRGRLELNRGNPKAAVGFLRRSTTTDPSDREALYALVVALGTEGTPEEIRAAEDRWKRCDADLKRVAELATLIARSPKDPGLRLEIGDLFLRNGREADGLRWLESAVAIDPKHKPTHRRLAAHFRANGSLDLATRHEVAAHSPD